MMVLNRHSGKVKHDRFNEIASYLQAGDLLVLNKSRTVPASFSGGLHQRGKTEVVEIRLAKKRNDNEWEVLIVTNEAILPGAALAFSKELTAKVIGQPAQRPTHVIKFNKSGMALYDDFYALGDPVRYEYIHSPWTLDYYQTVFATAPGSVEMPSAGRAFSWDLLLELKRKGIGIAFLELHTGLSYYGDDEYLHHPNDHHEQYNIPDETMAQIFDSKAAGGRIIAVGTTVVRALESAVETLALRGSTNLYVHENYSLQLVDGLITGLHEPEASHLDMLSAFVPKQSLQCAYHEALKEKYLWHEFGDINLIL